MKRIGIGLFAIGAAAIALSVWAAGADSPRYNYEADCQQSGEPGEMDAKLDRMKRPRIIPGMI